MSIRKIDDINLLAKLNLSPVSMKKIREYAEKKFSRKFTNIQQLAKFMKTDKLNAQRILVKEFNEKIDNDRKNKKSFIKEFGQTYFETPKIEKPKYDFINVNKNTYNDMMSELRAKIKKYKGKNIIVDYVVPKKKFESETKGIDDLTLYYMFPNTQKLTKNMNSIRTKLYNVPLNFSSWWSGISHDWWISSEFTIFAMFQSGKVFIYPEGNVGTSKKILQSFRDGVNHCVFTPIRNWAMGCMEESKSKQSKSRYNCILRTLDELEEKYKDGVPENDIPNICNALQVDIDIETPFAENKFIEAKCIKKRLKLFRFMNTRINHIDLNEVVRTDEYITVSSDELLKLKEKLDNDKTFYTFTRNFNGVNSISTLNGNYRVSNPFRETASKFEIDTGLQYCKVDDIDDANISRFIACGTHYNETVDFNMNCELDNVNHYDMKKAYANFHKCKYYEGLLGKITDFRETKRVVGVGLYKITNIEIPEGRFKQYNDAMKMYVNDVVYTSAELKMLDNYGVKYDIVCGCWGIEPIHFEFPEEMLQKDEMGTSYYAKWVGCCDSHNLYKQFSLNGDLEFRNVIESLCSDKVVKWFENNEIVIQFPKKHNNHLGHITAFITAYTRLNMIEQLMEIDISNIVRVCVDGVYFTQEGVECKNIFRPKDDRNFNNMAGDCYCSNAFPSYVDGGKAREHYKKELHLGAGGCGKTHFNLVDKGLIRVLYVAPSWKLARAKKNEYNCNVSVWARLLSTDPEKITFVKERANVLLIDEVSMMTEDQKQQIFNTYSDMKIIMCGDLGYQLPAINGTEINHNGFDYIQEHNTNHRCVCPQLMEVLTELRKMIFEKKSKEYINKWCIEKFTILNRVIDIDSVKNMYKVDDMILSGTNEIKDFYTEMFKDLNKYYVIENSRLYSNGDIVINEKPNCKCEVRHCFTTHSIQGETAYNNLYIDSSRMFDSRMFYTAISRAKRINQIYIIQNTKKYKFNGVIYKIVGGDMVYIGSTIHSIEKRLKEHENSYKLYKQGKGKYITSFKVLENKNYKIEKIENFECDNIKELWKRESELIKNFECVNKTFKIIS